VLGKKQTIFYELLAWLTCHRFLIVSPLMFCFPFDGTGSLFWFFVVKARDSFDQPTGFLFDLVNE
jgi:hypothetical protein